MKHKTFELLETKADEESGTFTALVSVFGNIDHVGDRVMPGAFKSTLESWREKGDPIPVVLSHQWENPMAHIGVADPRGVMETEKGLMVQGKLDDDTEVARQVHKLMKRRSLKSFSFGYTVPEGGEEFKDGANEINEIDLVEIGPCLKGANPEAQLQEVKSALNKAARNVGPAARAHLSSLISYYMKKPHPFTACVRDNTKRFGPEGAKRVCATLKDIGMGTTHWRDGHAGEVEQKDDERDFPQELYDAAEGDFEGLMEMWHDHMIRNGDKSEDGAEVKDLPEQEVKTVESKEPAEPATPAAKDPLKNEIDLLRLEIAAGKPLRR